MQLFQKFTSLISVNNSIKQYMSTYENKELLTDLINNKLDQVESYLKERNIEGARSMIDIILCKKENLPEELECRLLYLKGNIEIELGNFSIVNSSIDSLAEKEKGKEYSLELKFKSALKLNNEELMREFVDEFILNGADEIAVLKREIEFFLYNMHFKSIIEKIDYIEKNQIKDRDVFHYIAVSYLNIADNESAIVYCNKAMECGSSDLTTCVKAFAEINIILQRKGIMLNISEQEKEFLEEEEIILIELIKRLPEEIIEEVIILLTNIYLIIDSDKAIKFYQENKGRLSDTIESKFLSAKIYELSNEFENAKEKYLEVIAQQWSEEVMIHIMFCMRSIRDYINYVKIFEQYHEVIEDEDFLLTEFYCESLVNIGHPEKMREKLKKVESRNIHSIRFKIYMAKLEERRKEKIMMLKEAEDMLNNSNQYDRISLKDAYLQVEMFDEAIRITAPLFKHKDILAEIVETIIKNKKKEFYLELIKEIDKHKDIRLFKYKKIMLEQTNELLEAKRVAEEIYKVEGNRESLIDLIQMKINTEDTIELESLILELHPLEDPSEYMIASYVYLLLGNIDKYKSYSYESIFLLRGVFDEYIFRNYVSSRLSFIKQVKDDVSELNIVKEECVVVLNNENEEIKICLNSESKYQTNEENFECLHISKDNPIWIELISQNVGDEILLNNRNFIIQKIIGKDVVVFQYCFKELQARDIDFGVTSVNIEDIEEKMKECRIKDEESIKNIFELYNSQEGIGLPFSKIFFGEDIQNSIEVLQYLILNEKNSYYIGTPDYSFETDVYVLSYQTLLLLENYNILDIVINDPKKYYVSHILKSKIINSILDIKKNKTRLYIYYDHEKGLYKEERDSKLILEKFRSIMDTINKLDTFQFNYKVRDKVTNLSRQFINEFDVETIYLAKEVDGVLIIDDLFIRKLINSDENINDIKHTNITILLGNLYRQNVSRYFDVIKEMVNNNIKYVLDEEYFKRLILEYKDYGYDLNWFNELINDMQKDEHYRVVMLSACKKIHDLKSENVIHELMLVAKTLSLI